MKDSIAASSRTNYLSQTTKQYWTQDILLGRTGSEHFFDSSILQRNHMVSLFMIYKYCFMHQWCTCYGLIRLYICNHMVSSSFPKRFSVEPDLNQRPMDNLTFLYSPPLYQLSYRRLYSPTDLKYLLRKSRATRLNERHAFP